jgi:hypothetical protein
MSIAIVSPLRVGEPEQRCPDQDFVAIPELYALVSDFDEAAIGAPAILESVCPFSIPHDLGMVPGGKIILEQLNDVLRGHANRYPGGLQGDPRPLSKDTDHF